MELTGQVTRTTPGLTLSQSAGRRCVQLALLLSDGAMLALAFALAYWLRFRMGVTLVSDTAPLPAHYIRLVAILVPILLALFGLSRLYDFHLLLGGTVEYARAFNACTVGMMLVVIASFVEPDFVVARAWLLMSWLLSALLVIGARFGLRRAVYALRRRGFLVVPALIVGTNGEATALMEQLRHGGSSGLQLLGFIDEGTAGHKETGVFAIQSNFAAPELKTPVSGRKDDHSLSIRENLCPDPSPEERRRLNGLPILGSLDDLAAVVQHMGVAEVIVAATALDRQQLLDLFEQLAELPGVEMRLSSGLFEVLTTGVQVRTIGFTPLLSLNRLRLDPIETILKAALDYGLTLPAMVVLWPVFVLIALLIKLDSPGPVFHRRRVLGTGGVPFDAFKFRTMGVNGDEILARNPHLLAELRDNHKLRHDPRVTRVGRWLRRYSLDELPQLFNVLLGQMSLVGPRMISPQEAEMYGRMKWNLLSVKPGITGLWQVSGRSDVPYEERVRLDMYYIRHYTIWQDLQILFVQTLPAVLKGRGAY